MKQPEPETRGGDEPGAWHVDGAVTANAAAVKAQLAATTTYIADYYASDEQTGGGDGA